MCVHNVLLTTAVYLLQQQTPKITATTITTTTTIRITPIPAAKIMTMLPPGVMGEQRTVGEEDAYITETQFTANNTAQCVMKKA